jgi:hypothetical protein
MKRELLKSVCRGFFADEIIVVDLKSGWQWPQHGTLGARFFIINWKAMASSHLLPQKTGKQLALVTGRRRNIKRRINHTTMSQQTKRRNENAQTSIDNSVTATERSNN